MIVKPAEQTSLSALYYAHLAKQARIPDGVINMVTGYEPTADAAISSHMDINMVSFTGSTEVGRLVMQASAMSNLKMVSLELGSKSPRLIFDDADVDMATNLALMGVLVNKGKACISCSRYVQEGIYNEFKKKVLEKVKDLTLGDLFDPSVRHRPQARTTKPSDKIMSYIDMAKEKGRRCLPAASSSAQKGSTSNPPFSLMLRMTC